MTINEYSEIVNNKKQLVLKIEQNTDYVYPNELYEYTIYCHNASLFDIEDVHIQVISPENILIPEDQYDKGIPIGTLKQHQSHLLRLKARCSDVGTFTVHFLCYGKGTGLFTKQLTINCDYQIKNNKTLHRIHIYNFTPYEEKYMLQAEDYNETTTRLQKIQKLPNHPIVKPFSFTKSDYHNGVVIDESQSYLDQNQILYGDPQNTNEHSYQYIDRENFNKDSVESFEGENLIDVINQINDHSRLFRAKLLRTGTNELLNDFKEYNPNGFFYRFGLMSSELFHYLGVLPEYSYMNDVLFRWAPDNKQPMNLYPKKVPFFWDTKRWVGHGYHIYKTYTDEYLNEIQHNADFTPMFEFVESFESKETAETYIDKAYETDMTNIYYINTPNGVEAIRKYKYVLKESFFDNGVFYIHIPLYKIPSNFYIPSTEEIESIVQRTKPFGMKPLIRYVVKTRFHHNLSFNAYPRIQPRVPFHLGEYNRLRYTIIPQKYMDVTEKICVVEDNNIVYKTRDTTKLIPYGKILTNKIHFEQYPYISMKVKEPRKHQRMEMDMKMKTQVASCSIDQKFMTLSDVTKLLYQRNFDNISFTTKNIGSSIIGSNKKPSQSHIIHATQYNLWTQVLQDQNDNNLHSRTWTLNQLNEQNGSSHSVNFFKISLTNTQITRPNIETGIGFKDNRNILHGISAEFSEEDNSFVVKYATSKNNVFKIKKEVISDLTGLAFYITPSDKSTTIIFFIEKNNEYHYFHHIIIPTLSEVFCFIRNNIDISSIIDLANIVSTGVNVDTPITFNTPQHLDKTTYDYDIIDNSNNNWVNLFRIDKNEHSYASVQNMTNNIMGVSDIKLHFDNINIPDDAIIKDINMRIIAETNALKPIYYSLRNQDGFITPNSVCNSIILYPNAIETYPIENRNQAYYEEQYNIAINKDIESSIAFFENKLEENRAFDALFDNTLDYLSNIDEYLTVKKPFWVELSDFTTDEYIFNDIESCQFVIEGYNNGGEASLIIKLSSNNQDAQEQKVIIPSGHFTKHIPLSFLNSFTSNNISVKYRFEHITEGIDIFDTYMDVTFKNKQETNVNFEESEMQNIEGKKIINLHFITQDHLAYLFKNGFTTLLEFDDLELGEYYRIYSVEVSVIYQARSIDFLLNETNRRNSADSHNFVLVTGDVNDAYLSGMFFDDLPSAYQYESTNSANSIGIELQDTLYQSFEAQADNITSVTLYPNGFVGNPDSNIRIGLYTNHGYTPDNLIKEITVNGWSKTNDILKDKEKITYNFNVNNLDIGETYWLKISVENPSENSYYILKYMDTPNVNFKLLTKVNNNLINTFSSLKFQINSINLYKSFKKIPISQDYFNNPNIFIGLNRGQGTISNIKVKKVSDDE